MSIRLLSVLVLCASFTALSYATDEIGENEVHPKGGKISESSSQKNIYEVDHKPDKSDIHFNLEIKSHDKNTPEKSSSSEKDKHGKYFPSTLSKHSESSSEERKYLIKRQRRSLDSKQESLNAIGESVVSNQTIVKETKNTEKDNSQILDTTTLSTNNSDLNPLNNEDDAEKVQPTQLSSEVEVLPNESTTEQASETTTIIAESEITITVATTEAEVETTTLPEEATTTVNQPVNSTLSESNIKQPGDLSPSSETNEEEALLSVDITTPSENDTPKSEEKVEKTALDVAMARVNKLSDQIRLVLENYRKVHAVVIPGQSFFQDPMPMQDFQKSFSIGVMSFKNMTVYGLSNFTVEHINTDVDKMQVYILLHMKRLVILGNYTLRTFFNRAAGPFNVTLLEVDSEGVAEVETAAEGHLEATDSVMDMFSQDMKLDFKNLGFMNSMFQGLVGTVGDALFNSIKPQILARVNIVIRTDVNKKLKEFSNKFINKVAPVDLAFSEGRKYVRTHGYDPYKIKDHTFILGGLVFVNITEFWVEGLSRFYRVGNLSLSMDSGDIEIGVHVMTHKLTGNCIWSGQTFGIVKSGKTNFTVDHLQIRALVTQSLDVRKKPQLKDLDLELGWVKVTMDSPMSINLMIEGIINAFPRLIRHIIVDSVEQPLKEKIQEILDKINVESIVDDNLPRLDSFGL